MQKNSGILLSNCLTRQKTDPARWNDFPGVIQLTHDPASTRTQVFRFPVLPFFTDFSLLLTWAWHSGYHWIVRCLWLQIKQNPTHTSLNHMEGFLAQVTKKIERKAWPQTYYHDVSRAKPYFSVVFSSLFSVPVMALLMKRNGYSRARPSTSKPQLSSGRESPSKPKSWESVWLDGWGHVSTLILSLWWWGDGSQWLA